MIKNLLVYYFSLKSLVPRLILIILLPIHDLIKTKTLRTFNDLFYWPDGICPDMIIVYIFLIGCIHILFRDFVYLSRIFRNEM